MERQGETIVKSFSLKQEHIDWLKTQSKIQDRTMSQLIRRLIDQEGTRVKPPKIAREQRY